MLARGEMLLSYDNNDKFFAYVCTLKAENMLWFSVH